MLPDMG
jgi:hypothetical protein